MNVVITTFKAACSLVSSSARPSRSPSTGPIDTEAIDADVVSFECIALGKKYPALQAGLGKRPGLCPSIKKRNFKTPAWNTGLE